MDPLVQCSSSQPPCTGSDGGGATAPCSTSPRHSPPWETPCLQSLALPRASQGPDAVPSAHQFPGPHDICWREILVEGFDHFWPLGKTFSGFSAKIRPLKEGQRRLGIGISSSEPPPCDIPSRRYFFTGPWTVTRSSLCMLRRVTAFCRPLRPVLLLVSFPRSRSPVVGVLGLC